MTYLLGRLAQAALVVLVAGLVCFALFRFVGDPVNNMVGQAASLADRAAMRAALGLDDATPVQFVRFLLRAFRGDFGISYGFGLPVSTLIAQRFPATFELSCLAMLVAVVLGIPLGAVTALHPRRLWSRGAMLLSLLGVAMPTFLLGLLLILLFSVTLGWLPSFGRGDVVAVGGWSTGLLTGSGRRALVLPALTLGLFQMTLIMRVVRAEMLQVLRTDYIRFARARGLRPVTLLVDHALRNTLVPVVTLIGLQFGNVFAFSVVVETVFQWPGLGLLIIQAIQFADTPVIAAYLLLVATGFAAINLGVDLLYAAIDPRVRAA